MKTLSFVFSAALCMALASCNKQPAEIFAQNSDPSASPKSKGNIFVCGYESNGKHHVAKYWRDGVPVALTDGTRDAYAFGIAVSDNNIYVAGIERNDEGYDVAKYWKNGNEVILSDQTKNNSATGIAVQNGDVYVSGYEDGPAVIAKYWKNGNEISLNANCAFAQAYSVFVSGNDVYCSGTAAPLSSQINYAAYWKNGVVSFLPTPHNAFSYSVFVHDNVVYNGGYADPGVAVFWRNDTGTPLGNYIPGSQHSEIWSTFVYNKTVYNAGMEYSDGYFKAAYWKNNEPVILASTSGYSSATSIVVNAAGVFVAGILSGDDNITGRACFWGNGNLHYLSDGSQDAGATQIFITP